MIYLDSSASAPVFSEVVKAMLPYFSEKYGNPSSPHQMGEDARKAIESARKEIAHELGCKAHEIIFTSGGTEANILALMGVSEKSDGKRKKIIISAIEHSSVFDACEVLEKKGYNVVEIGVNKEGKLNLEVLEKEIDYDTLLVSVIHGNNEIGTIQDIRRIGALCKKKGVLFHTDAVQSFGKEIIKVHDWNVDLLSASAHKIGGTKGTGFLYLRSGVSIYSIIHGGQEGGRRGGTENVAGIVGFAKALEIIKKTRGKIKPLRNFFMEELEKLGGKIIGSKENRLEDHVSVFFSGIDSEKLVLQLSLKGIMCSTKSACLTKERKENRVLNAIGLSEKEINGAVRFGLHSGIRKKDIQITLKIIGKCLKNNN